MSKKRRRKNLQKAEIPVPEPKYGRYIGLFLIPPVTALCVFVDGFFQHDKTERAEKFRRWTALWTGKGKTLESSEHLFITHMCYYLPILGVMGLLFGIVFLVSLFGLSFSDEAQNAVFFGPLVVFAYSNFLINGIEKRQQSFVRLRLRLNAIVELVLFVLLYVVLCFITWVRSIS